MSCFEFITGEVYLKKPIDKIFSLREFKVSSENNENLSVEDKLKVLTNGIFYMKNAKDLSVVDNKISTNALLGRRVSTLDMEKYVLPFLKSVSNYIESVDIFIYELISDADLALNTKLDNLYRPAQVITFEEGNILLEDIKMVGKTSYEAYTRLKEAASKLAALKDFRVNSILADIGIGPFVNLTDLERISKQSSYVEEQS